MAPCQITEILVKNGGMFYTVSPCFHFIVIASKISQILEPQLICIARRRMPSGCLSSHGPVDQVT